MEDTFITIKSEAEGLYREKGSRFMAFGFPVENEEDIRRIITNIKKKHHNARHHCYAYRLEPNSMHYRVNDDGEPSGTAGKPIFGQIHAHDLYNILIIVVRYFGGTLLGTSGLINAYRSAAADLITHAQLIERVKEECYQLEFPFESTNSIMKMIKEEDLVILEFINKTHCKLTLSIRKSKIERVIQRFTANDTFRCSIKKCNQ